MSFLIVHGGCGVVSPEHLAEKDAGARAAARAGRAVLEVGGSALDAVEAAVCHLEDDPAFNAGTGSVLTLYGEVEMDASVMSARAGALPACGAVAAVRSLRHPVTLARRVMEITDHVFLVGQGAEHFARLIGTPSHNPVTEERQARWRAIREQMERGDLGADELEHWKKMADYVQPYLSWEERRLYSTVGAVAVDDAGAIAAATSTGGIWFKLPGRVGDTPVIGAGTWAGAAGAASATGHGEGIIRLGLAQRAVFYMESMAAAEAVSRAVSEATQWGVECGLIGVDAAGRGGVAFNTPHMPAAEG